MHKFLADKYNSVKFDEKVAEMYYECVIADDNVLAVLGAIATDHSQKGNGLTKSMMYQMVKVKNLYSYKNDNESNEADNLYMSSVRDRQNGRGTGTNDDKVFITRKIADNIVNYLLGTTLIYQDRVAKEIYYRLTSRGMQVCLLAKKLGKL